MKNLNLHISRFLTVFFTVFYVLINPMQVYALSNAQKEVLLSGVQYYNVEEDFCSDGSTNPKEGNNNIYVMGDSLTVGMQGIGEQFKLSTLLKNKGWNPTVNAQSGRPLWYPGDSQQVPRTDNPSVLTTSAFFEYDKDQATIKAAGAAIVALGTNDGISTTEQFKSRMIEYIEKLRFASPNIVIYWVNLHTGSGAQEGRNAVIKEVVAEKSIKLIDYRAVAEDLNKFPWGDAEKVHLTAVGYKNKAALIADQVGQAPSPAAQGLAAGSKIYMVGSSTTAQSKTLLEQGIASAGYVVSKINAEGFRSLNGNSDGGTSAIDAITTDSSIIAGSDAVVVAIFNGDGQSWSLLIPDVIAKIREAKQDVRIYVAKWFTTGNTATENNTIIDNLSGPQGYTVIETNNSGIVVDSEGIHPTPETRPNYVTAILNGLKSGVDGTTPNVSTSPTQPGQPTSIDLSGITWGSGIWSSGSSKFVSNFEGPYTLEYWAISVLKNIARKTGKDESTMVTPAKVLSLVVFAKTEGGGYGGHNGTFNPLNKKGTYTDIPGANQGNSANDSNSEGYTTFDDGVEAITRGLFGNYQKRVGGTLLDPNMSPEQFMEAVTGNFYVEGAPTNDSSKVKNGWESKFPGDKAWAAGSITNWVYNPSRHIAEVPPAAAIGVGNRDAHLTTKMGALNSVKNDYAKSASIVLDMPNRQTDTRTPPPLQYTPDQMRNLVVTPGQNTSCASVPGVLGLTSSAEGTGQVQTIYTGEPIAGAAALGSLKTSAVKPDPATALMPDCHYDGTQPAGVRKGSEHPGAKAIQLLIHNRWGGGTGFIAVCKGSSNPLISSVHGEGRAVDSYHYATTPEGLKSGNEVMGWLITNAQIIGVQYVKFWRVQWSPGRGINCVTKPADQANHSTHVHFDMTWAGALQKTPHFNGQPAGESRVIIDQNICPIVKEA